MNEAAVLAIASAAIVVTLFVSPTTTDRVFYASGVLLVAALTIGAAHFFAEPVVRRFVVAACIVVFGYHVIRFVDTYAAVKAATDNRIAIMSAAPPGTVAVVPTFELAERTRWHVGDDFVYYPWLRDYVGGELFDLSRVELDRHQRPRAARVVARPTYDLPRGAEQLALAYIPTYRHLQSTAGMFTVAALIGSELNRGLVRFTVRAIGLFDDPRRRPIIVFDWTASGSAFVDGRPHDDSRGHFIRVRRTSMPDYVESTYMIGCGQIDRLELVLDDEADPLLPVDERHCRGPFTAIMCEPQRCWVAGWY